MSECPLSDFSNTSTDSNGNKSRTVLESTVFNRANTIRYTYTYKLRAVLKSIGSDSSNGIQYSKCSRYILSSEYKFCLIFGIDNVIFAAIGRIVRINRNSIELLTTSKSLLLDRGNTFADSLRPWRPLRFIS